MHDQAANHGHLTVHSHHLQGRPKEEQRQHYDKAAAEQPVHYTVQHKLAVFHVAD